MLSNSSKYAIKAVLYLAVNSSVEKKIMIKDITEPINVPQAYIAKLLQLLVKEKLISSARGPKGGFYLTKENLNETTLQIIYSIDGENRFNSCLLSLEKCDKNKPCPLHKILSPSRKKILKKLKNKTIKELSLELKIGNAFLPL